MRDPKSYKMYAEIAEQVTAKLIDTLVQTIKTDQIPDLYWKLEKTIVEALRYADSQGAQRTEEKYRKLIADFDESDGTSQN